MGEDSTASSSSSSSSSGSDSDSDSDSDSSGSSSSSSTTSTVECEYVHLNKDWCPGTKKLRTIAREVADENDCPKYSKKISKEIMEQMDGMLFYRTIKNDTDDDDSSDSDSSDDDGDSSDSKSDSSDDESSDTEVQVSRNIPSNSTTAYLYCQRDSKKSLGFFCRRHYRSGPSKLDKTTHISFGEYELKLDAVAAMELWSVKFGASTPLLKWDDYEYRTKDTYSLEFEALSSLPPTDQATGNSLPVSAQRAIIRKLITERT